jgi:outer membrane protein, heavy metal efflux system
MRIPFRIALLITGLSTLSTAHGDTAINLAQAFALAWERQPAARSLPERQSAAQSRRAAADALTVEPPSLELAARSDRFNRDRGAEEQEVGLVLPLWLPGQRQGSQALADSAVNALNEGAAAQQLKLAGDVRDAWWAWQLALNEQELALARAESAKRLRDDVAKRVAAGDLARTDQHQADAALAMAEAVKAAADAQLTRAGLRLQMLTGQRLAAQKATAGVTAAEPEPAAVEFDAMLARHPALRTLEAQGEVARRQLDLARNQRRANPELTVSTRRERGLAGESMEQTWALALRIPFSGSARSDADVAGAHAEAIERGSEAERERERLSHELGAAQADLAAARSILLASETRARLAGETRHFVEKSFQQGESDLPARLRVELEAFEAEKQHRRARIELARSISSYRQALGLLPE